MLNRNCTGREQSLLPLPDFSRKIEGDSARRVKVPCIDSGFALLRSVTGLAKLAPLYQPMRANEHAITRVWGQRHVMIASNSDWFIALFVSVACDGLE